MNRFDVARLGPAKIQSPVHLGTEPGDLLADYVPDDSKVLASIDHAEIIRTWERGDEPEAMEVAGPREHIYFDPTKLKVGIVTCGGLCPGLNNVIRGLVMTLHHGYGVRNIYGFRYGFAGLNPDCGYSLEELSPKSVLDIHKRGGTILGTSRGPQPPDCMVDTLERMNIRLLFTIGGDGTFRGALALHKEIESRGLKIGVIGVPKTIDNDIILVDRTFGFDTAVGVAAQAIEAAYHESSSVHRGIGLVKLMGRHSGFIAANAALAVRNVNLVLIPEVPFDLEGKQGLLAYLERRFAKNKSTVIVVAEGAGQKHLEQAGGKDASGNAKLGDIGIFLKHTIRERLGEKHNFTLKYIDPSYIVRSSPADSKDSIFCGYLAQHAAHAGMSGRTGMAVGRSYGRFTHIPISELVTSRKEIDPEGTLWLSVMESTGQPFFMASNIPKQLARHSFYVD